MVGAPLVIGIIPGGKGVGEGVDGTDPGVGGLCGRPWFGDIGSFGEGCPDGWGIPGGPISGPEAVVG